MTQEQFQKAVRINDRLKELERVKKEIDEKSMHRLWYANKGGSDYRLAAEWVMKYIGDLLDKHDLMIRQEIDEEIKRLEAEIETL